MNYRDCEDFIQNRMRMSHVYQPVMLMTLLRSDGKASVGAESAVQSWKLLILRMLKRLSSAGK